MTTSLYIILYVCVAHVIYLHNIYRVKGNALLQQMFDAKDSYIQSLLWAFVTATSLLTLVMMTLMIALDKLVLSPVIWLYNELKSLIQELYFTDPMSLI